MGAIKEKMIQQMAIRGLSESTRENYLRCARQFVEYFRVSPDQLGVEQIHEYQLHLIEDRAVAVRTYNLHVAALRFLYGVTLKVDWRIEAIPYRKGKRTLPIVLSPEEVIRLYRAVPFIKHKAIILTFYATGARVAELVHLKTCDIDSRRMVVRIEDGKGGKDRYVPLSEKLLKVLRRYWVSQNLNCHTPWLFPGWKPDVPYSNEAVQKLMQKARERAGINKPVTAHTLRHSFATNLLESGVDIRRIQLMLGHRSLKTTAVYLHIASNFLKQTGTPLDSLDLD